MSELSAAVIETATGAAADDAALGAADTAANTGEQTASPWAGLNETQMAFVGDRNQSDLVDYAISQRQGASARREAIIAESGLFKPLGADDDVLAHMNTNYGPADVDEYAAITGMDEANLTPHEKREMAGFKSIGMHPKQFQAYHDFIEAEKLAEDLAKGPEYTQQLEDTWGADYKLKDDAAKQAVKALEISEDHFQAVADTVPVATIVKAMDFLSIIGKSMGEGGPINGVDDTGQGGGAQTAREQLTALENKIGRDQGGVPTPEQQAKMDNLINEIN